jgi:hypothetical protein
MINQYRAHISVERCPNHSSSLGDDATVQEKAAGRHWATRMERTVHSLRQLVCLTVQKGKSL